MNHIAEQYAKLVLGVGLHDADYVDAFHGPQEWKNEIEANKWSLGQIKSQAEVLLKALDDAKPDEEDELSLLRKQYLFVQLKALIARVEILDGKKMSFDEESQALYDAVAPTYPESHFQHLLQELDTLLPGRGSIPERYEAFKSDFIVPPQRLDTVFQTAIAQCRHLTKQHMPLPDNEQFSVEYVTDRPWSAYNWYKGGSCSLIQMNTELPVFIDRAIDLAAHEGYPGHHVHHLLLEEHLMRRRGWMEFSVYALFSPQSLIAEGTANFGIEVVMSKAERLAFERDVLFPAAGLDATMTETYYAIHEIAGRLAYADNEVARRYLNNEVDHNKAITWLVTYGLKSPDRAQQRMRFIDRYRSYVINYNLGQDMVKQYIEVRGGNVGNPQKRWEEFTKLLSSPRLPSGLAV